MQYPSLSERKSFFLFLGLVLTTAFSFFESHNLYILGAFSILWGFYGLLRFIHLNQSEINGIPKFFNLPTQILFGAEKIEKQHRLLILERLSKLDILTFLALGAIFIVWVIYNNFFPAEFTALEILRTQQEKLTDLSLNSQSDIYALAMAMARYNIVALMIIVAISYSQGRFYFQKMIILIFPLFIAGIFLLILNIDSLSLIIFPNIAQIKGLGLGQVENLMRFAKGDLSSSLSPFMIRYIESGIVGAYGLYALFVPALYIFIKTYRDTDQSRSISFVGSVTLVHLWATDAFWLMSSFTQVIQALGVVVMALCWGSCLLDKRILTKEQK